MQKTLAAEWGELLALTAFAKNLAEAQAPYGVVKKIAPLRARLVDLIRKFPAREYREAATAAVLGAAHLSPFESDNHTLARCFDFLDDILGIDYPLEVLATNSEERLFVGSAAGVQSSYSGLFQSLKKLKPKAGDHVVDLGSGFGRLGLIVGLLRSDMFFSGYEYVPTRVAVAQTAAAKLGIDSRIKFFAQDLSRHDFEIPLANIYYLYDPFSPQTYRHVLRQLSSVAAQQSITLLTKGHAADWVENYFGESAAESFDYGNMRIFEISRRNSTSLKCYTS